MSFINDNWKREWKINDMKMVHEKSRTKKRKRHEIYASIRTNRYDSNEENKSLNKCKFVCCRCETNEHFTFSTSRSPFFAIPMFD